MESLYISQSVGVGGKNSPNDIKAVQTALNALLHLIPPTGKLIVDGKLGSKPTVSKTVNAITLFQKEIVGLTRPDGKIEVNGKSHKKISEKLLAASNMSSQLPNSQTPTSLKQQLSASIEQALTIASSSWQSVEAVLVGEYKETLFVYGGANLKQVREMPSSATVIEHDVDFSDLAEELDIDDFDEELAVLVRVVPPLLSAHFCNKTAATWGAPGFAVSWGRYTSDKQDITGEVLGTLSSAEIPTSYAQWQLKDALLNNDPTLARELVAQGTDLNKRSPGDDESVWHSLLRNRENSLYLRRSNIDQDSNAPPPSIETLATCIDLGADLEAKTSRGETALLIACGEIDTPFIKLLIARGAEVKVVGRQGAPLTKLMGLPWHPDVPLLIKLLLEQGADPSDPDPGRWNQPPLLPCASYAYHDALEVLLAHGADVNAQDDNGRTALGLALEKGHTTCITLLLVAGASLPDASIAELIHAHEAHDASAFALALERMQAPALAAVYILSLAQSLDLTAEAFAAGTRWLASDGYQAELMTKVCELGLETECTDACFDLLSLTIAKGSMGGAKTDAAIVTLARLGIHHGYVTKFYQRLIQMLDRNSEDESRLLSAALHQQAGNSEIETDGIRYDDPVIAHALVFERDYYASLAKDAGIECPPPSAKAISEVAKELIENISLWQRNAEGESFSALYMEWPGDVLNPYEGEVLATALTKWIFIKGAPRMGGTVWDDTSAANLAPFIEELPTVPEDFDIDDLRRAQLLLGLRLAWIEAVASGKFEELGLSIPTLIVAAEHDQDRKAVWTSRTTRS